LEIKTRTKKILKENLYPEHIIDKIWRDLEQMKIYKDGKGVLTNVVEPNKSKDKENKKIAKEEIYGKNMNKAPASKNRNNTITNYFKPMDEKNKEEKIEIVQIAEKEGSSEVKETKKLYVSLPYINKKVNYQVKRLLKSNLKEEVIIVDKPINKTSTNTLSNVKDKIDKKDKSGVIYEITCNDCQKSYIGQTKQYLKDRLKQHASTVKLANKKQHDKTALSQHAVKERHHFNFQNTKILDTEANYYKRIIKESLYIQKNIDNVVNFKTDTNNISIAYNYNLKWMNGENK